MMDKQEFDNHINSMNNEVWTVVKNSSTIPFNYQVKRTHTCIDGCKMTITLTVDRVE